MRPPTAAPTEIEQAQLDQFLCCIRRRVATLRHAIDSYNDFIVGRPAWQTAAAREQVRIYQREVSGLFAILDNLARAYPQLGP